jgi:hypothetical protein
MINKITPGPWRIIDDEIWIEAADGRLVLRCEADHCDADVKEGWVPYSEGMANAKHVVRCVNTQDTMLRALLVALSHLQPPAAGVPLARTQAEACDIVAAAIRAATEEA